MKILYQNRSVIIKPLNINKSSFLMIKKFHLSLNMMSSRYFRAFRELSEEYRARDNRVLYFGSSIGWLENTRMSTQPICYWKESK